MPERIVRMLIGLPIVAGIAAALAWHPGRASAQTEVRAIFLRDCATCHGADGAGSARGPSLLTSGRAGVDFYLSTGRMPIDAPTDDVQRHGPKYDAATISALVEYVAALPGFAGADIPRVDLAAADIAQGGVLFRLNCAACHAWSGRGGALLDRESPSVLRATPTEIAEAMLVGPGTMPVFGDAAFGSRGLDNVTAYTRKLGQDADDRGGFALWHLGPLPEGALAVIVGLGLLLVLARMIGTRERA
jgi:ubiquinol-cytochrome c reductase cytochrome c subunit